jgi:hypothetical protein
MMSTMLQRGSTITSSKTRDRKDEPNAAAIERTNGEGCDSRFAEW